MYESSVHMFLPRDELERMCKDAIVTCLRYYRDILLSGLRNSKSDSQTVTRSQFASHSNAKYKW
jgi:hypothetical protein